MRDWRENKATWKEDRESLRKLTKEKMHPLQATVVYAVIAHMQGKIHMRCFRKYHGGWMRPFHHQPEKAPAECLKAYGEQYADHYYTKSLINSLEDQAAWITWAVQQRLDWHPGLGEITNRSVAWDLNLLNISVRVLNQAWEDKEAFSQRVKGGQDLLAQKGGN